MSGPNRPARRSQDSRINRVLDRCTCRACRLFARSSRNSATASRAYSRLVPGGNSKTSTASKGLANRTGISRLADAGKVGEAAGLSARELAAVWVRPVGIEGSRLAIPEASAASTTPRARAAPVRHGRLCAALAGTGPGRFTAPGPERASKSSALSSNSIARSAFSEERTAGFSLRVDTGMALLFCGSAGSILCSAGSVPVTMVSGNRRLLQGAHNMSRAGARIGHAATRCRGRSRLLCEQPRTEALARAQQASLEISSCAPHWPLHVRNATRHA